MALNERFHRGENYSAPVPAGTKSGAPLRLGGLNVVAQTDRNEGTAPTHTKGPDNTGNPVGYASVRLVGDWTFDDIDFEVTDWGSPVYITSANALTATATGNALYGHATSLKAATAGPLSVRITN